MKKQLLFNFSNFIFQKTSFGIAALTVLILMNTQFTLAQQWNVIGQESDVSALATSNTSIAVVNNGVNFTPYVVYTESGVLKVKKRLSDGTWTQLSTDLASSATYSQIYADPTGNLYVAYIDLSAGSKLAIKKYDYIAGTWDALNPADSNSLYVSTGNVNQASTKFSGQRFSIAFDSFNTPYVAFSDVGMIPYVKQFNGTSWVTVGTGPATAGLAALPSLAIDSTDKPWLVYSSVTGTGDTTGTLALFSFNGTVWTETINPTPISNIRQVCIANYGTNKLYFAMFDINSSNKTTVIYYDKTANTWSSKSILSSRDGQYISLINDSVGNVYCSYIDKYSGSSYLQVARVHKLEKEGSTWTELFDVTAAHGIDEPTGNVSIAIGSAPYPYVVYTKTNSSSVTTPIVRGFVPAPPPAVLTTNAITNITTTTAECGGNITSNAGQAITERGVVYSISNTTPTTANTKVAASSVGTGNFSVTLSGLTPTTLYYTRAYAINSAGTSYGEVVRLNTLVVPDAVVTTPRQVEFLTRGLVAVRKSTTTVYLSWRMLGTDPSSVTFNVYRNGVKITTSPITNSTNYLDTSTASNDNYSVTSIVNGVESTPSIPVFVWASNQMTVPIQIPVGGTVPDGRSYTYEANDASVGDVDGDGIYEIILKWNPTIVNDNAGGYSGKQIFDCYKLDGTLLWRIDLGINMNAGPHYNQFMVYDFDGDGKAEIILKTADGTVDGTGVVIGNSTVDYRNSSGWVQQGPEFLTVFNGLTGAAMSTVTYQPSRDNVADWGDNYGNRQDRFVSAVAYLDGARPSLIVGRGYYNRLTRAAYDWRDGQLTMRWKFDSKDTSDPGNEAFSSQGNHQMQIGDVDGDGKDEVINGSSAVNDNGKRLWTYGMGHGDALHMTDMDLDLPGQEIWINLESPSNYTPLGLRQYDAKTGRTNWGIATGTDDVGRSMAADIDPNYKGYEMWGSSGGNVYDSKGNSISTSVPSYNFGIWWDGDLGRELLDRTYIDKWNPTTKSAGRLFTIYQSAPISSNNSTKSNPCLMADIFGDWREEVIYRRSDNTGLVIFTTNTSTNYRIPTLMHDTQYRTAIAWQNSAYNQPPYPSYYIGYDMATDPTTGNVITPTPNIYVAKTNSLGLSPTNGEISSSAIKAYPNPTSGLFSLQLNSLESGKASIKIVALNGQVVKQRDVLLTGKNQTVLFDISAEASGVYLLKVTSKEGETTQKIILQK
ncbi:rhamnogalacturonan lyase family protein [Flavobacterium cellulosilyticum]|uniref:T9SS type A sorting domain-containing protein n=1 Tax=Flavobacterium cellulosilyticum TaxID=2541731 RepID=A0A4R5C7F7_9FLAO|nr:T9SS type A sorting domain-containing protein [Flavobacterium cellulosilyticum]TDD95731.1 T9SS type A sorting domain-containing protein [Flavobacterium cellulosilyticum]